MTAKSLMQRLMLMTVFNNKMSQVNLGKRENKGSEKMGSTRQIQMIKIDSEALASCLKEKGITQSKASIEVGYSDSYIAKCLKNSAIPKSVVNNLDFLYDIKLEEYKKNRVKKAESKTDDKELLNVMIEIKDILQKIAKELGVE